MFIPIGLLPALLWPGVGWRLALLLGGGASLLIELGQLFCSRSTDIDDIILNTLGTLAGYGLYLRIKRACPGAVHRCRIRKMEEP